MFTGHQYIFTNKKLHISLIFSNLVVTKIIKYYYHRYVQLRCKVRKNYRDLQTICRKYGKF